MLNHLDIADLVAELTENKKSFVDITNTDLHLTLRQDGDSWLAQQCCLKTPNIINPEFVDQLQQAQHSSHASETDDAHTQITAPLPGVFYRSPKPGAPPFVNVGDIVSESTLVCIIESMKLMNSVYAGVRGRVAEICVNNGEFTDKNTVLLRIEENS